MASEFASLVALVVPLKRAQLFSDAEMARYNAAVGVSMERECDRLGAAVRCGRAAFTPQMSAC